MISLFFSLMLTTGIAHATLHELQSAPSATGGLATLDVAGKRALLRSLAIEANQPANFRPDQLITLEQALTDDDMETKRLAFASVSKLAMVGSVAKKSPNSVVLAADPAKRPAILRIALQGLSDSDPYVRIASLNILVAVGPLQMSDELRAALITRYSIEPEPSVRRQIVARLGDHTNGGLDVQELLVAALDDASAEVRQQAAIATATFRPAAALSRLVERLESDKELDNDATRHSFVVAVSAFGRDAIRYLPLLRQLRIKEGSEIVRHELDRAIKILDDFER